MLSLDEAAQRKHEAALRRERAAELRRQALEGHIKTNVESVAADAGRPATDISAQTGTPLHVNELMRRLRLCNASLHFEVAILDGKTWGVYLMADERSPTGAMEKAKKFICGVGHGMMPEFSILTDTEINVPDADLLSSRTPVGEVAWKKIKTFKEESARGWRTVVARLLHARLISESDARRHFQWTPTVESKRWHDATR